LKVLIVDDHPIVVSGFKSLLESEDDIVVCAATSPAEGEALFVSAAPDVAVIDINLPGQSGFVLAGRMLARDAMARIIMFSMNDDPVFVTQAKSIGARGFVSKNDNPMALLSAIRAVVAGGEAWSATQVHSPNTRAGTNTAAISTRDHEVLRFLASGKSLSEIADLVGVSYKTVANTCVVLRSKLGARTQSELVRIAVERRLV
jgi:two-component system, NarL family, invasion response regulator UvrY